MRVTTGSPVTTCLETCSTSLEVERPDTTPGWSPTAIGDQQQPEQGSFRKSFHRTRSENTVQQRIPVHFGHGQHTSTPGGLELGYARVSTTKQSLDRQLDALASTGLPDERIYVDKKTGATVDRPVLTKLLEYARPAGQCWDRGRAIGEGRRYSRF
ncbi:MAG TPA: recombinase family protein [Pseudonocardiaceae bacterium]|nr:recombinase family protein [Pseudonocardiaceae bacterium]